MDRQFYLAAAGFYYVPGLIAMAAEGALTNWLAWGLMSGFGSFFTLVFLAREFKEKQDQHVLLLLGLPSLLFGIACLYKLG